jgi:hypothetical protein
VNTARAAVSVRATTTQVEERRAEARKAAAQAELHRAFATEDVEELRTSAEAAWVNERDREKLRAAAEWAFEQVLARTGRVLRRIRNSQDAAELREFGLQAVRSAGWDGLCAMAAMSAARAGADVNAPRRVERTASDGQLQVSKHDCTQQRILQSFRAV